MQIPQSGQSGLQQNIQNGPVTYNHGGHELNDVHEILSGMIGVLEHYTLYRPNIKDQELMQILNNQYQFLTDEYNMIVQAFSTGQDPAHGTRRYQMTNQNNESIVYGLRQTPPKQPKQAGAAINDGCYAGFMLGHVKGIASLKGMAASEVTNPVVRRVIADSIPNNIEMSYELFLWANKNGYYQVAQYDEQTTNAMVHAYVPATPVTH
ncbi:spore coat protein [Shimazuella kribbensis]|uniref:spore coat protein n=1 Tax=Shimazuella kribbensis TaxID=139808 RepID=UPI00040C1AD2|nr:spore coat protein [Shimazuella kribbensis]